MKIFSFNSELNKITGVQKVLLDIHKALRSAYPCIIIGTIPYEKVSKDLHINKNEYKQFINPFIFYKSIVFVHERKFLLLFWFLNHFLFQQIKVIYIHHNILYGWRRLPIYPKVIVSISDRGTENLVKYFGIPTNHIHKIYNCVQDICPKVHRINEKDYITILYPARINNIKRQIDIVNNLNGKIPDKIKILFAGEGPYYHQLKDLVKDKPQFICLGFRNDILNLLTEVDYIMLFSKHEGLPISLIEATMCGTPIICNDVGGNLEIAHKGANAFIVNKWDELTTCLNHLPDISNNTYMNMTQESRKIYEQNFTFETFQQKYIDLIYKILNL